MTAARVLGATRTRVAASCHHGLSLRAPAEERAPAAGPVRKIVVCVTARALLPRGVPMLSVQDDLAPASGILIGVSIGTAVWEVAIFIVWHFM